MIEEFHPPAMCLIPLQEITTLTAELHEIYTFVSSHPFQSQIIHQVPLGDL